jgi:outer membrane protein OmpA-like peptidoglycan-associated protein
VRVCGRSRSARRLAARALVLAAAFAATLGPGGRALAQEPPDTVPSNAKREIRSLAYVVENLAARIDDLRVKESDLEIRVELAADVLFDFDKSTIRPAAEPVLTRAAALLAEKGTGVVRIEGHTDAKGSNSYNQPLSERRAAAVKSWLTAKGGLAGMTFTTKGFGSTRPVAPNTKADGSDDPDGRQKNRRVDIVITKKR